MSKKALSRKRMDDYESDDGFVEDAPKGKKQKSEPKKAHSGVQKDDKGDEYWELSGKRRVQISEFKGNTMIGIREYFEKDGEMLPGKKGISMTVEQYTTFLELIPEIEKVLKAKGVKVPRPKFDGESAAREDDEDGAAAEEGGEESEDEEEEPPARSKSHKTKKKRNHDVTSDEDDD